MEDHDKQIKWHKEDERQGIGNVGWNSKSGKMFSKTSGTRFPSERQGKIQNASITYENPSGQMMPSKRRDLV
jgi:hypothetical protein